MTDPAPIAERQSLEEPQGSFKNGPQEGRALSPKNSAQVDVVKTEAKSILPSTSSIVQAGAFGAALGGMTTGVMEIARVKKGEVTSDQALKNIASASAQGAATMAVATVASQVVRSHPVFGFAALAAAGIGAFMLLTGGEKDSKKG